MRQSVFSRFEKSCRWLRYRNGFGVHSPFAFSLINDVIDEDYLYYAYSDIFSKTYKLPGFSYFRRKERQNYHRFLFRLSNFVKPKRILAIGSDGGSDLLHLMAPSVSIGCTLVDFKSKAANMAYWLCEQNPNFLLVDTNENSFQKDLSMLFSSCGDLSLVVIHNSLSVQRKQNVIELCLLYQKEQCAIVVDDIYSNADNRKLWRRIIEMQEVTVSFDLITCGVFWINNNLNKKNYKYYL